MQDISSVPPSLAEVAPGLVLSYRALGPENGIPFVLLPGMGSGAGTMHKFPAQLLAARPDLRIIVASPRCMEGGTRDAAFPPKVDMHFLAQDVVMLIEHLWKGRKVFLGGWAYGHRTARCVAADRPDLVKGLVMYASGGLFPASKEVDAAQRRLNKERSMPFAERVILTKFILASDKTDDALVASLVRRPKPESELTPDEKLQREADFRVLRAQSKATFVTPKEDYLAGGNAPILLLQGRDDRIARVENGWWLYRRHPDRIRLVDLDDCGHWLIYEKPAECVRETVRFIADVEAGTFDAKQGSRPGPGYKSWNGKSRL
ncbi:Alpha/Beta hydrolase protein [Hyaloraphidium curvatum]|nr:Alpha/Beta hydrolase protein [Hyaloraphidium curvatum]